MQENIGGFTSAPIKLAAIISRARNGASSIELNLNRYIRFDRSNNNMAAQEKSTSGFSYNTFKLSYSRLLMAMILIQVLASAQANPSEPINIDNIVPMTHFNYKEGRQSRSASDHLLNSVNEQQQQQSSDLGSEESSKSPQTELNINESNNQQAHIYKRSSALLASPRLAQYSPLVGGSMQFTQLRPSNPHLSRRIMMSPMARSYDDMSQQLSLADPMMASASSQSSQTILSNDENTSKYNHKQRRLAPSIFSSQQRDSSEDPDLLRQKQHIQYHDQWPSLAGKCHKRTLNFCASVLPFNTTTFPNIIGDSNRFEVKRSLPFFGFLAKSSCNKRLDELLCLLLEPPCSIQSGLAIPPCKKFCRLALEGCNEYIPATLALSSVFDCRQYPDSNDPSVCVNLAQGNKCGQEEFKCPDKTCIPSE